MTTKHCTKDRFKSLYLWSQWANTGWGAWAIFLCAFADASFLPLPTLMFVGALTLINVTKTYKYALCGTVGTLLGALAGYSIGHFAWINANGEFSVLAQFLFNHAPGFSEAVFNKIYVQFVRWDFGALFIASFVPLPFKIFTISSGVSDMNLFMFSLATLISQGIKFSLLAGLILRIGPGVKKLLDLK
jgi:membrane protein YqaA with SNARE-associated domain